jgi:hypothetical protein
VPVTERAYVAPLTRKPLPHGLLDVADVTEDASGHWQGGGVETSGEGCLTALYAPDPCAPSVEKTVQEGYTRISGDAFAVYTLNRCRLPAGRYAEAQADARKALEGSEGPAVEARFAATVLRQATNVGPATGAVPLKVGIGILEGYAGQHYGGLPILHMPRSLVQVAGVTNRDGGLFTLLDTPVVAGAGYEGVTGPANAAAGAGNAWLFITGEVGLTKGAIQTYRSADLKHNEFNALAERTWAAYADCLLAAVRVVVG